MCRLCGDTGRIADDILCWECEEKGIALEKEKEEDQ
jgi:hypothetical protein